MGGYAFVSLDTGKVYWHFDDSDVDEDLPADIETSDRYVVVPHKSELDLGRALVLRFVDEYLPEHYDRVRGFFSRSGAYRRFKDFLDYQDALERWYSYENAAVEEALREWCAENGLELVREPKRP